MEKHNTVTEAEFIVVVVVIYSSEGKKTGRQVTQGIPAGGRVSSKLELKEAVFERQEGED